MFVDIVIMDHEDMDYHTFLSFEVVDELQDLSDKDSEKKRSDYLLRRSQ